MDIKSEILSLLRKESPGIDISEKNLEMHWKELKIDSLSTYFIITQLEDAYKIKVSDEDVKHITTPTALIDLVILKIKEKTV